MSKFIIDTIWAEIDDAGNWRVDATRSQPDTTLEDVIKTVHNLRQRDNVLACEWHYAQLNINNKENSNG